MKLNKGTADVTPPEPEEVLAFVKELGWNHLIEDDYFRGNVVIAEVWVCNIAGQPQQVLLPVVKLGDYNRRMAEALADIGTPYQKSPYEIWQEIERRRPQVEAGDVPYPMFVDASADFEQEFLPAALTTYGCSLDMKRVTDGQKCGKSKDTREALMIRRCGTWDGRAPNSSCPASRYSRNKCRLNLPLIST